MSSFGAAAALMRAAEADWLARTAGERARRHLVRLLDWAIEVSEEVNLERRTPQDPSRQLVRTLVEQLQAIAGLEVRQPADSFAALEQLFELQELYLLARIEPDDEEDDHEEETVDVAAMSDAELARAIKVARATGITGLEVQMDAIAAAAGVTLQDLRGPSRRREIVELRRQIAAHLQSCGLSLPAIARLLQRDHTTVAHLLRTRTKREGTRARPPAMHSRRRSC
jgi:hypothetical protein